MRLFTQGSRSSSQRSSVAAILTSKFYDCTATAAWTGRSRSLVRRAASARRAPRSRLPVGRTNWNRAKGPCE
jgi:hypothetical protein